mgnify:CR=1 FL=1
MSIKIKSECSIRTPFEHSVTIPSDTSLPESVSGSANVIIYSLGFIGWE